MASWLPSGFLHSMVLQPIRAVSRTVSRINRLSYPGTKQLRRRLCKPPVMGPSIFMGQQLPIIVAVQLPGPFPVTVISRICLPVYRLPFPVFAGNPYRNQCMSADSPAGILIAFFREFVNILRCLIRNCKKRSGSSVRLIYAAIAFLAPQKSSFKTLALTSCMPSYSRFRHSWKKRLSLRRGPVTFSPITNPPYVNMFCSLYLLLISGHSNPQN